MYVPYIRSADFSRLGRVKVLTALTTVSLALVAASPAGAEPKSGTPAKKGCTIEFKGEGAGQSITYDHGYSFSVQDKNTSKTHTYTCNDGKWKETVSLTRPPVTSGGLAAPIAQGGTFQVLASGAGYVDSYLRGAFGSGTYLNSTP